MLSRTALTLTKDIKITAHGTNGTRDVQCALRAGEETREWRRPAPQPAPAPQPVTAWSAACGTSTFGEAYAASPPRSAAIERWKSATFDLSIQKP